MAEPTMPTELWMFWATTNDGRSFWLVSIDETSGADDLYLVTFSEESAKRIAKEQTETYFNEDGESVIPVRVKPMPGPATAVMLKWVEENALLAAEQSRFRDAAIMARFLAEWTDAKGGA